MPYFVLATKFGKVLNRFAERISGKMSIGILKLYYNFYNFKMYL